MAKVLLVVNDVSAGYELRRALLRAGHTVFLEYDGRVALTLVERETIDFIACDPVLPGSFGTDLIVAARATSRRSDLPAALLRPLPEALNYELLDAEPVRVLSGASGNQLIEVLEQLGLGTRRQERRRFPNRPSLHRRRSTDAPCAPEYPSDRPKE